MSNTYFSSSQAQKTHGFLLRVALVAFASVLFTQVGCNMIRSIDETAALTFRDFVWSKRAYNLRYGNCNRPYSDHFRQGFCSGYEDVAGGGDGYVPALPPEDYRSYEFQSADGAKCVNAWFEGYPAGVAAAKQDKAGSYNDIMISRMIDAAVKQDKNKGEIPTKVAAKQGRSRLATPPVQRAIPITPGNAMPSVMSPAEMNSAPPVVPAGYNVSPNYSTGSSNMPVPFMSSLSLDN